MSESQSESKKKIYYFDQKKIDHYLSTWQNPQSYLHQLFFPSTNTSLKIAYSSGLFAILSGLFGSSSGKSLF